MVHYNCSLPVYSSIIHLFKFRFFTFLYLAIFLNIICKECPASIKNLLFQVRTIFFIVNTKSLSRLLFFKHFDVYKSKFKEVGSFTELLNILFIKKIIFQDILIRDKFKDMRETRIFTNYSN